MLFAKGMAMGAADMVPGVSGGTVALITGIYGELVDSIKAIDLSVLKTLRHQGVRAAWEYINGTFLLTLVAGIASSVLVLAQLIDYLLRVHGLLLWSFFFGVIAASSLFLLRTQRPRYWYHWFLLGIGMMIAVALSQLPIIPIGNSYGGLFLAGTVAFCAMIIPGLSGTLLLVAMGLYPTIVEAIAEFHLQVLLIFCAGGAMGLLVFSRVLSWLMRAYQTELIVTMSGFLIGSLPLVWPWQVSLASSSEALSPMTSAKLWPADYAVQTQMNPQTLECILFLSAGLLLVAAIGVLNNRSLQEKSSEK